MLKYLVKFLWRGIVVFNMAFMLFYVLLVNRGFGVRW